MKNNTSFLIGIGLFLTFYGIYLFFSFSLYQTGVFRKYDLLFQADVPRVINNYTSKGRQDRTSVHPLFVLLVNPIGRLLVKVIPNKILVAIGINSFFGALGVALAYSFFLCNSKELIYSLLFAVLFGISTSQLVWSSVPETYSLGICSLILNYILFAFDYKKEIIHRRLWILAGLFSIAVATTNFVQSIILYTFALVKTSKEKWRMKISSIISFVFCVLSITIVLALMQKMIYPSSNLFFVPRSILYEINESGWFNFYFLKDPLKVIEQIVKNFFLVNIIAPIPNSQYYEALISDAGITEKGMQVTFSDSWNYLSIGWVGLFMWITLLTIGFYKGIRGIFSKSTGGLFYLAIFSCLLFEALLHSCYGWFMHGYAELFLYTGYFTFLTLIIASWSINKKYNLFRILLGALCILGALNNAFIVNYIINYYSNINY